MPILSIDIKSFEFHLFPNKKAPSGSIYYFKNGIKEFLNNYIAPYFFFDQINHNSLFIKDIWNH